MFGLCRNGAQLPGVRQKAATQLAVVSPLGSHYSLKTPRARAVDAHSCRSVYVVAPSECLMYRLQIKKILLLRWNQTRTHACEKRSLPELLAIKKGCIVTK
jgi:hypothetical protein